MRRFLLAGLLLAAPLVALAGGGTRSVQLREASVRSGPKHFKALVATLKYADKVEVISEADGWFQVRLPDGREGYLHSTALTEEELTKVAAGGQGTSGGGGDNTAIAGKGLRGPGSASQDEVALAGNGFNPQVEKQYRADHRELEDGYKRVDWMERRKVDGSELELFLAEGKLGGAQ